MCSLFFCFCIPVTCALYSSSSSAASPSTSSSCRIPPLPSSSAWNERPFEFHNSVKKDKATFQTNRPNTPLEFYFLPNGKGMHGRMKLFVLIKDAIDWFGNLPLYSHSLLVRKISSPAASENSIAYVFFCRKTVKITEFFRWSYLSSNLSWSTCSSSPSSMSLIPLLSSYSSPSVFLIHIVCLEYEVHNEDQDMEVSTLLQGRDTQQGRGHEERAKRIMRKEMGVRVWKRMRDKILQDKFDKRYDHLNPPWFIQSFNGKKHML